ncbi:MAG: tetratricopeptide repeat protein [Planctomycetales bacterium]|nr:tetratricopeptide repeat protein [Planctomycetales bacterium]
MQHSTKALVLGGFAATGILVGVVVVMQFPPHPGNAPSAHSHASLDGTSQVAQVASPSSYPAQPPGVPYAVPGYPGGYGSYGAYPNVPQPYVHGGYPPPMATPPVPTWTGTPPAAEPVPTQSPTLNHSDGSSVAPVSYQDGTLDVASPDEDSATSSEDSEDTAPRSTVSKHPDHTPDLPAQWSQTHADRPDSNVSNSSDSTTEEIHPPDLEAPPASDTTASRWSSDTVPRLETDESAAPALLSGWSQDGSRNAEPLAGDTLETESNADMQAIGATSPELLGSPAVVEPERLPSAAADSAAALRQELEMSIAEPQGPGETGRPSTYTIQLRNASQQPLQNITAVAYFSAGMEPVSIHNCHGKLQTGKVVCTPIPSLQPNQQFTFQVVAKALSAGSHQIRVEVSAANPNLMVFDEKTTHLVRQATATTMAAAMKTLADEPRGDLELTVIEPSAPVAGAETSIYTLSLRNRGAAAVEDVQVNAYFSAGIDPVSLRGKQGQVGQGQVALDPIVRLEPGEKITCEIAARSLTAGEHTIRCEAVSRAPRRKQGVQRVTEFVDSTELQASYPATDDPAMIQQTSYVEPPASPSRTLVQQPKSSPRTNAQVFAMARKMIDEEQLAAATKLLSATIDQSRADSKLLCLLGECHYQAGNFEQAAFAIGESLAMDESEPRAHYLLGWTLFELGDTDVAHAHFRRANELDSRYVIPGSQRQ